MVKAYHERVFEVGAQGLDLISLAGVVGDVGPGVHHLHVVDEGGCFHKQGAEHEWDAEDVYVDVALDSNINA